MSRRCPARIDALHSAQRWPTASPVACVLGRRVVALDLPRLRARLGRLHPFAIRRAAAGVLRLGLRATSARCRSSISTIYGGGFDMPAALLAKVLPFDLFETRRLLGAAVGIARTVRHLADRPPPRRAARRADRARRCSPPARSTTGTCSSTRRTRRSRWRWRSSCSASCARFEEYPRPVVATSALVGLGFGLSIGSRIMGASARSKRSRRSRCCSAIEARADGIAAGRRAARPLRAWRSCRRCCSPMR